MNSFPSNEYELIERIRKYVSPKKQWPYELVIGDDAAVRVNRMAGERLIITTDVSVENVHFSLDTMTFEEIGYKAMVSNLSDCAAMGALPDSAVIQLVFPKENANITPKIERLYTGFARACKRWNFPIVGGDLSVGAAWIIGITLIGAVSSNDRILKRTGIINGDILWVTGMPGMSAAGLACIHHWGRSQNVPIKYHPFIDAHISPIPKIDESRVLAKCEYAHAMMDLSDGLSKDVGTLCHDNNLGFIFDRDISIPPAMISLADELNRDWRNWFYHGGEEYELLVSCSPEFASTDMIRLGYFTSEYHGMHIQRNDGGMEKLSSNSWDHIA